MKPHQISIYTQDERLSNEILEALKKEGSTAKSYFSVKDMVEYVTPETKVLVIDYDSGLFYDYYFQKYIKHNFPEIKVVILTSLDNLMHCYKLLGDNIFEVVIKNKLTILKINRIVATLSYYNQFSG